MFKNYYFTNYLMKSQFNQKVNFLVKPMDNTYLYELELIFKLPSLSQNRNKFILMLVLMEKLLNNKLIFLLDKRTLTSSKSIKIGCLVHLRKEMLYSFVDLYCMHNIPKFYRSDIIFDFSRSLLMKYEIQKILSNIVFNFDKDLNFYYDYLNEFDYSISFFFKSIFRDVWLNKILLNRLGIIFYNSVAFNIESIISSGWYLNLIEEEKEEEEYEELDDLLIVEDIDYLGDFEEINETNVLFFSFIFSDDILENNFTFYLNFEF